MGIAKNNKFTGSEKIDDETLKKAMNGAALKDKTKSNAGAKKLPAEEKLSTTMVVYFTEEEKLAVKKYCKNKIPFSTLVRQFLIEKGIL